MFELLIIAIGLCNVIKINMNAVIYGICTWVALCPSFCCLFFSLVAYLFNNIPLPFLSLSCLSFFLALLMLCLINLYCFSYSFLSFVYFNFGIIRRFGECRMCPKLFFFYFGFWGFVFRFSGSFAQHKINTHSTSALNK